MKHHHLTATEAANIHDRVKADILTLYRGACGHGCDPEEDIPARDFFIDLSVELGKAGVLCSMVDYAINPTETMPSEEMAALPPGSILQ